MRVRFDVEVGTLPDGTVMPVAAEWCVGHARSVEAGMRSAHELPFASLCNIAIALASELETRRVQKTNNPIRRQIVLPHEV